MTAAGPGMRAVLHDLAPPTCHRSAWDVRWTALPSHGSSPGRGPTKGAVLAALGWDAESYADRPAVAAPHALHSTGLTPHTRYRHTVAVVWQGRPPSGELLGA